MTRNYTKLEAALDVAFVCSVVFVVIACTLSLIVRV